MFYFIEYTDKQYDCFLFFSVLKTCVKIGEGIYGEVFRAQHENGEASALKVFLVDIIIYRSSRLFQCQCQN